MPPSARNHHVVPQGYLAAFTDTGLRSGRLCVFDIEAGKFFGTTPRNVASRRDFNRVNVEGQPEDTLEKAFGGLEDRAVSVIRRMREEACIPLDEDFNYVLNLISLLVIRNPRRRAAMVRAMQHEVRIIGDLLASDEQLYEHHVRKARESGDLSGPDIPFERMKRSLDNGNYTVSVPTDLSLQTELAAFKDVLQLMGARCWSLLTIESAAPDLVTSDLPVTLVHKNPHAGGPIGIATRNTEAVFPLDPRHALLGVFDDPLSRNLEIGSDWVGMLNQRTVLYADRQVFARRPVIHVFREHKMVELDMRSELDGRWR